MESKNPIYKKIFSKVQWLDDIVEENSESKSSYKFKSIPDDRNGASKESIPLNIIKRVFNINIDKSLYKQAISGDGKEYRRIITLHSSSLATFLFFHAVSREKPITISGYTFNEVLFEQKTTVEGSHKSNMDVVLLNKEERIVMFLECKFSEYLNSGKYSHISPIYKNTYEDLGLFDGLGDKMEAGYIEGEENIELRPNAKYQYCEGIKQMVSHYIGIRNFMNGRHDSEDLSLGFKPEKVFLAEILFALPEDVDVRNRRKEYEKAYELLAERINSDYKKPSNFTMLPNSFTYQDIFKDYDLSPPIKEFYML